MTDPTSPTTPDAAAPDVLARALCLARISLAFGRVERATLHEDGRRPETDTDHTVMLGLIGCELAPPGLDRAKVAAFALVHDLTEVYAGDTQTLTITAEGMAAKREREDAARARLVAELGAGSWVAETLATYEEQREPEARFVRALDKVLPKLTHASNGCAAARALTDRAGFVDAHARQYAKLSTEYPEFPDVLALLRASMDYSERCWPTLAALARLRAPAADVAAIVERHRLATPGPHAFESTGDGTWGVGIVDPHPASGEVVADYDEAARRWRRSPDVVESIATNGPDGTLADGRFLAHAWEDIGALLALIAARDAAVAAEREGHAAEVAGARAAALREAEDACGAVAAKWRAIGGTAAIASEADARANGARECAAAVAALGAKGGGA